MLKYLGSLAGMCLALSGNSARMGDVKAQASLSPTRQVSGYGLQLQLTIPRLTYPRDALVRVTIRLTNRSTHAIDVNGNDGPQCLSPRTGLGIEVLTKSGHLVFPPAAPWIPTGCRPKPYPVRVAPGASLVDHPLIVLRGSRVRAAVGVGKLDDPTGLLKTSMFHLDLTPRDLPPFTFSTDGGAHLLIGPVPRRHAALYYVESGECLDRGIFGFATWQRLPPTADGTYEFECRKGSDPDMAWAFTGGMLNHSVVSESVNAEGCVTGAAETRPTPATPDHQPYVPLCLRRWTDVTTSIPG